MEKDSKKMEQDGTRWNKMEQDWKRLKKMLLSPARGGRRGGGVRGMARHVAVAAVLVDLKISKIEKNVSSDHTRPCISTSNKNIKIHVRIYSTVKVIRACIFIMLSVLEVTQRVQ